MTWSNSNKLIYSFVTGNLKLNLLASNRFKILLNFAILPMDYLLTINIKDLDYKCLIGTAINRKLLI
jgi:hypothetical protein